MSKYEKLWCFIKNCNENTITLTFAEIGNIVGVPLDHAVLRCKKELSEYDWAVRKISLKEKKVTFEKYSIEKTYDISITGSYKDGFSAKQIAGLD